MMNSQLRNCDLFLSVLARAVARYQVFPPIISSRVDPCSIAPRLGHPRIKAANYSGYLESQMSIWTRICYRHHTVSPASGWAEAGCPSELYQRNSTRFNIVVGLTSGRGRAGQDRARGSYLGWAISPGGLLVLVWLREVLLLSLPAPRHARALGSPCSHK